MSTLQPDNQSKAKPEGWQPPEHVQADPLFDTLQLRVLRPNGSVLDQRWRGRKIINSYAVLYFVVAGGAVMRHHDTEYQLTPEQLYLIPADSCMTYACEDQLHLFWVRFEATIFGGLEVFNHLSCDYELPAAEPGWTRALFEHLIAAYDRNNAEGALAAEGYLRTMLAPFLARLKTDQVSRETEELRRFEEVFSHIHAHLDRPLSVVELAEVAHFERSYFTKLFRRHFNMPPSVYIQSKRIEETKRRLVGGDDTLEQIADDMGFADAFHLSRTFKRLTGASPSEFRKHPGLHAELLATEGSTGGPDE